ncbi:MAG: molybdenum cofactor biosynthesis protein MoaE [Phycisphaerales bacterium]
MTACVFDISFQRGPVAYEAPPPLDAGGGECVFLGRTRAESSDEHGDLERLTYEAYETMAVRVLRELAEQTAADHDALFIRIRHSIGEVPIGDASVFIQVVCGHRAEAFAACRFLIDRLKTDAPIWKREVWADGAPTWSESATPAPATDATRGGDS